MLTQLGLTMKNSVRRCRSPKLKTISSLEQSYDGMKVILSVDRLDYSKGIPDRLNAFRTLLEQYPKWRGKVKLIMIAVPSRTEVRTYQELRETIEQAVSRINGEFGTVDGRLFHTNSKIDHFMKWWRYML